MRNWLLATIIMTIPLLAAPFIGLYYPAIHIPSEAQATEPLPETIYYVTNGNEVTTGFTVFQRQQVAPKFITITDTTGTMEFLNPGPPPQYPATFGAKLCYSSPFNLYSNYDNQRLEVWQDAAGTATVQQVLTVCPQLTR